MSETRKVLDHFRKHLRITGHDLDAELEQCLMAAVTSAENYISSVLILSNVTLTTSFESSLTLRKPLVSVSSVAVDGEAISSDLYSIDNNVLEFDDSVDGDEVVVTYKAGYENIPADINAAVMLHASSLFSNPLDSVETLPKASALLLRPYRVYYVEG